MDPRLKHALAYLVTFAIASFPVNCFALDTESVNQRIQTLQTSGAVPGIQVTVTQKNRTIFEYTRGIRAIGHPESVQLQDQWHLGSCTKPMTAFLIGRLVDRGLLRWTTTVGEVAPHGIVLHPSVASITVEQLLSHSSGLVGPTTVEGGQLWPLLFAEPSQTAKLRSRLVAGILELPTQFSPGSKRQYSNSGYVVLGWIIEQRLRRSWEQVIRTELFRPLQMKSCGFGPAGCENAEHPTQPWSHIDGEHGLESVPPGISADNPLAVGPAGTVHCNAQDWTKFLRVLLNHTQAPRGWIKRTTYDKLLSTDGATPYTFATVAKLDRKWAQGPVYSMAGSNTMNYAIMMVAPAIDRIYTINLNSGTEAAEAAAIDIASWLTELE